MGLAGRASFEAMDGRRLAYPDGAFDAVFASRVLVHAFDPEGDCLRDAPGTPPRRPMLLLVEPDRDGILGSLPHDEVDRLYWRHRRSINPCIGRHLYSMCRGRAGLVRGRGDSLVPRLDAAAVAERRGGDPAGDLAARSGDYWELVRAGLTDEAALAEHAAGVEEAARSGINLRTDLEFVVLATKPGV